MLLYVYSYTSFVQTRLTKENSEVGFSWYTKMQSLAPFRDSPSFSFSYENAHFHISSIKLASSRLMTRAAFIDA